MTPGERLRQSLRKQTKDKVARRVRWKKDFKKNHFLVPGRETPDSFFLTAHEHSHEHDESWRCVHVDVREVRENHGGFAYAGQGQIMNLSQFSGHVACVHACVPL